MPLPALVVDPGNASVRLPVGVVALTTDTAMVLVGGFSTIAGLAAFCIFNCRVRRRLPPCLVDDPSFDPRRTVQLVHELTGVDVSDWDRWQCSWLDTPLLQDAHHNPTLGRHVERELVEHGLVAHRRTTFGMGPNRITIGTTPQMSVAFFSASGPEVEKAVFGARRASLDARLNVPSTDDTLIDSLKQMWEKWELVDGETPSSADPANPHREIVFEIAGARRKVRVANAVVTSVESEKVYDPAVRSSANRQGRLSIRLQSSAWIAAIVLALYGLAVLIGRRQLPDIAVAVSLGVLVFVALVAAAPQSYAQHLGLGRLNSSGQRDSRRRFVEDIVKAGGAGALSVTVATSVGAGVNTLGISAPLVPSSFAESMLVAVSVMSVWLGLSSAVHFYASRYGWWEVAPELSPADLRSANLLSRVQIVSISIQSAVVEEVFFRLMVFSVVTYATDEPLLGAIVAAALWALCHDARETRPVVVRILELTLLGLAIQLVFVYYGLISVILLHCLFNIIVLTVPRLSGTDTIRERLTGGRERVRRIPGG